MSLPEKMQKWYREFLGIMTRNGYDIFDPMSNYAIQGFVTARAEADPDSHNSRYFYAGLPSDEDGVNENLPENGVIRYNWMKENFVAPANFSEDRIRDLYKLANEGRLLFRGREIDSDHRYLLYTDKNGRPVLSKAINNIPLVITVEQEAQSGDIPGITLPPKPQTPPKPNNDPDSPEMARWERENTRTNREIRKWHESAEKILRPVYYKQVKDYFPDCPDAIKLAENFSALKESETTFFGSEWFTEEDQTRETKNRSFEGAFFKDYTRYPEYYKNEEDTLARVDALKKYTRNPDDPNALVRNPGNHLLLKRMIEKTGKSVGELCRNGMITYEDGTRLPEEKYSWNTVDRIITETGRNKKTFIIYDRLENGIPAGPHRITLRNTKIRTDVPFEPQNKAESTKPYIPENMVADITGAGTEKNGGAMSTRQRMKVKMEDGTELKGYFTADSFNDTEMNYSDIINRIITGYESGNDPERQKTIPYLIALRDHCTCQKLREVSAELAGIEKPDRIKARQPFSMGVNQRKIGKFMRSIGLSDNYIRAQLSTNSEAFAETANKVMEELIFLPEIKKLNEATGIKEGMNINRRNNAMSEMADMLGIGDVIARSVNMTVKDGEKNTTGTFMLNAEGIHFTKLDPLQPGFGNKEMTISVSAIQKMNKLQILDYLCANVDRHVGNFMFQFDTTGENAKITGVQGFDNDLSFGDMNHRGKVQIRKMSCIPDIKVIDENLAKSVIALKPEDVEHMLRSNGMNDGEINAAKLRLTDLQDHILSGKPRIIPADQWNTVDLNELNIGGKSRNIYNIVNLTVKMYNKDKLEPYRKNTADYEKKHQDVLKEEKALDASASVTENTTAQLIAQSKRLKEIRDNFVRTDISKNSDEFEKMYNSLGKLIRLTDTLANKENGLSDKDFNMLSMAFNDTRKLSQSYINAKDAVPFSTRGKHRLSLAKNLEAFCADRRHTVLEESVAAMNVRLKTSIPDYKSVGKIAAEVRLEQKPDPDTFATQIRTLSTVAANRKTDSELVSLCGQLTDKLIKSVGKDTGFIEQSGLTKDDLLKAAGTINVGKAAEKKLHPDVINQSAPERSLLEN